MIAKHEVNGGDGGDKGRGDRGGRVGDSSLFPKFIQEILPRYMEGYGPVFITGSMCGFSSSLISRYTVSRKY